MSEEKSTSELPHSFFVMDRGERAYYETSGASDPVRLPVTRDGFEALLGRAATQFDPPIPLTDSLRIVFAGFVHSIDRAVNTTTIEAVSKALFKSISNALTWIIDQELKAKKQAEIAAMQAKMKADAEELERNAKKEAAAEKRQKKANKYTGKMKSKSNEAKAN